MKREYDHEHSNHNLSLLSKTWTCRLSASLVPTPTPELPRLRDVHCRLLLNAWLSVHITNTCCMHSCHRHHYEADLSEEEMVTQAGKTGGYDLGSAGVQELLGGISSSVMC